MSPPRARVIRAGGTATAQLLLTPSTPPATHKRIARERFEAQLMAERIERDARARAEAILGEARAQSVAAGEQARDDARREAQADAIAQWLTVRRAEAARAEGDAGRVIALAVVLAERLLGAALEVAPSRIAELVQGVLSEARGARRATVEAHPTDAAALRQQLGTLGFPAGAVDVRDDPSLARGALRLHTDVGTLDAQLAPRLERLAVALADVLADARP